MDNLPKTWDDWIENFKAWQDNVGYDREWMGDFDLSIQFDWERAGDTIEFGDYEGRRKWERSLQVPHQSMRDALVSMITVQGDTEFASVEQQATCSPPHPPTTTATLPLESWPKNSATDGRWRTSS